MNRKLQEIEARRALEVAEDEGRAHIDELLKATQDRLAGQSEKLIASEELARELERQVAADAERLEELEAQLRQHQMAEQMRELHTPRAETREVEGVRSMTVAPRRRSSRRCRWTPRRRSPG